MVSEILHSQGYPVKNVELGRVEFEEETDVDLESLRHILKKEGFELIDDQTSQMINSIKVAVIALVHEQGNDQSDLNLSDYLERKIGKSYSGLSSLFSRTEGRTIEKYLIQQRIERVKELLVYGEKTISEIAWELGYSSAQYLSNQFKSETGLSPSEFRSMIGNTRKPLDEV